MNAFKDFENLNFLLSIHIRFNLWGAAPKGEFSLSEEGKWDGSKLDELWVLFSFFDVHDDDDVQLRLLLLARHRLQPEEGVGLNILWEDGVDWHENERVNFQNCIFNNFDVFKVLLLFLLEFIFETTGTKPRLKTI